MGFAPWKLNIAGKIVVEHATKAPFANDFTNADELLPDVKDGQYLVSVRKDKKNVLSFNAIPLADGKQISLSDFPVTGSGNKGSAIITATFGGKVFKGRVKFRWALKHYLFILAVYAF